ncbi:flagellar motor protein MotB [Bermanella sp. R86510]|uniref:flagellar motor protein MotB n=1 Tax=unclassified Bermanella TaxID=2627862 RepID=UPI0037CBDB35
MPRRHTPPDSAHVHRWMVSYADLMTLLFAVFAVLYAASSINNEKFDSMKQALEGIFAKQSSDSISGSLRQWVAASPLSEPDAPLNKENLDSRLLQISDIKVNAVMSDFTLSTMDQWIGIEVPMSRLFTWQSERQSYDTRITMDGAQALEELAQSFTDVDNKIVVEVFTGDTTGQSNPWLLGARQGSAIVQYLQDEGIAPTRIAMTNYGPFQPIASSADEEGRQLNYRVMFLLDRSTETRQRLKAVTERHLTAQD